MDVPWFFSTFYVQHFFLLLPFDEITSSFLIFLQLFYTQNKLNINIVTRKKSHENYIFLLAYDVFMLWISLFQANFQTLGLWGEKSFFLSRKSCWALIRLKFPLYIFEWRGNSLVFDSQTSSIIHVTTEIIPCNILTKRNLFWGIFISCNYIAAALFVLYYVWKDSGFFFLSFGFDYSANFFFKELFTFIL